jgi:hypothetical protein
LGPENQKKISSKEYSSVLKGLELKSLYFSGAKFALSKENIAIGSIVKIESRASFKVLENNSVEVAHSYRLRVINKENKKIGIRIRCDIILLYSSKETFSELFFEIFKGINLPINTWPYFREYVSSSISRMNVPPLVLPLFKRT